MTKFIKLQLFLNSVPISLEPEKHIAPFYGPPFDSYINDDFWMAVLVNVIV